VPTYFNGEAHTPHLPAGPSGLASNARESSAPWATQYMDLTQPLVPSFHLGHIATPYRGVFDSNAGAMLGAVLVVEWVLAFVRRLVR